MVWDCLACCFCFFRGRLRVPWMWKTHACGFVFSEPSCSEERQEEETEVCGRQAAADEKEQPVFFLGGGLPSVYNLIPALWGMENRIKGFPNLHFIVCEDFADSYFCGLIGWSVFWHIFVGFQVVWRQESCRLRMDGPVVNSESEAITWITGIFWTVKLDVTEAPITQIDKDGWWIWLLRIIGPPQINLFIIVAGKKGVVCLEYKGLVE